MKRFPLHVRIRPLAEGEIRELEWRLPGPTLDHHRSRFDAQVAGELTCFVAWYDETSIGVIVVWWKGDQNAAIEDLFVLPAFRRRGVGAQLVARTEAAAGARHRSVSAVVPRANRPARGLFAERGYVVEGKLARGAPLRFVKALG